MRSWLPRPARPRLTARPRPGPPPRTPPRCCPALAAHAVWLDGEEVRLTPIEFALLRVLAVNRGLLMTHRQLLSEVWGPEHADATPLLRTHIANLRSKLGGGEGRRAFIRTDAGIGYRFKVQTE